MKPASVIGLFAFAAFAGAQQVILTGSGGYGVDSPYNRAYDRSRQVVFDGKVTGKIKASPMPGMAEGMSLLVKSRQGQSVHVDVGPSWFVARQVAKINVGDSVRVIGSQVTVGGQRVVLAKQIVNNRTKLVLALRDILGKPYWAPVRTAAVTVPANAIGGTIVDTGTIVLNGANLVSYTIQTPNGNVDVVAAPEWFMQRQDVVFSPGAYVQIVGARQVYSPGRYITVADTMYTGGSVLTLRTDGTPVWLGWGG